MIIDGHHVVFKRIYDGALAGDYSNYTDKDVNFIWATDYEVAITMVSEVYKKLKEMYPGHYNLAFELVETPIVTFARAAIRFDSAEDEAEFILKVSD